MTPEEIINDYNNAAQILNEYAAAEAAKIGNSQRSLGTLAERVATPSGQTSGLANYTYNRTMRPVVDSLTANLITTGKAKALENNLAAALRAAKNNYESSKNNYTANAGGNKSTDPTTDTYKRGGVVSSSDVTKKEGTGKDQQDGNQTSFWDNLGNSMGTIYGDIGTTMLTGPLGLLFKKALDYGWIDLGQNKTQGGGW